MSRPENGLLSGLTARQEKLAWGTSLLRILAGFGGQRFLIGAVAGTLIAVELGDDTARARPGRGGRRRWRGSPEGSLVARLKAQIPPNVLLSDPIVYTIDEGALARYERRVLVR